MSVAAVIAFGHVHFKEACAKEHLDWRQVRHVSNLRVFSQLDPCTTRVIVHTSALDRRQKYLIDEAERLGFTLEGMSS